MKEIMFIKNTGNGNLKVVLRIIGHILYFKYNNNQYANQVIEELRKKGAKIEIGQKKEWIRIDIFGDNKQAKIGKYELDFDKMNENEVEEIILDFYEEQYRKSGFHVEFL